MLSTHFLQYLVLISLFEFYDTVRIVSIHAGMQICVEMVRQSVDSRVSAG